MLHQHYAGIKQVLIQQFLVTYYNSSNHCVSNQSCWLTSLSFCGLCYINQTNCLLQFQLLVFSFSFIAAIISHLSSLPPNWQMVQLNLVILLYGSLNVIKQFTRQLFYIQIHGSLVSSQHAINYKSLRELFKKLHKLNNWLLPVYQSATSYLCMVTL